MTDKKDASSKPLQRSHFIDCAQNRTETERKPGAVAVQRRPVISGVFQNSSQTVVKNKESRQKYVICIKMLYASKRLRPCHIPKLSFIPGAGHKDVLQMAKLLLGIVLC